MRRQNSNVEKAAMLKKQLFIYEKGSVYFGFISQYMYAEQCSDIIEKWTGSHCRFKDKRALLGNDHAEPWSRGTVSS